MIKVLGMRLKGFSRVVTGLEVPEITIHFDELENEFFLFIGKNGTGKTSILHAIHPFAYNNAIGDSVANSEFIVSGEDGEKEIWYDIDGSLYEIRHMYLRKNDDSITLKSFIKKDGEELNPSGSVGIFEDIIEQVFELDKTYLGLLSLGNTISGFVDYTGGARKQIVTKIFSRLNIYSRYYKNASQEVRNIKSVLNNVTTKLDRYKDYDTEEAKRTVLQLEQKIEELGDRLQDASKEMGAVYQKISSNQEFIESYTAKKKRLMEILNEIDTLKGRLQSQKDIPTLQSDITEILGKIEEQKIHKGSLEANLKVSLDYMESLKGDLEENESTISRIANDIDLEELDRTKADLEKRLAEMDIPLGSPVLDKDKLVRASIFLEELKGLCIDFITEVNHAEIVADTAKTFFADLSLVKKSEDKYASLVEVLRRAQFIRASSGAIANIENFHIPDKIPCGNTDSCPYVAFYNEYIDMVSKKTGEIDNDIAKKQYDVDIAKDVTTVGKICTRLKGYIDRNKDILDIPTEIFDPNNFIDLYMERREVADMDLVASMVNLAENQFMKKSLLEQLAEVEEKRKNNQSIRDHYDTIMARIDAIQDKIKQTKLSTQYYQEELPKLDEQITKLEDVKKRIERELELVQDLESLRGELAILRGELSTMENKSSEIEQFQSKIHLLQNLCNELSNQISDLRKQKEDISLVIQTISSLRKEQHTLLEQYGEAESIRNATSPIKGVPLEYIKKYVKGDLIRMVNELLELVYGKELYIDRDRVNINETDFIIPYRRRGTLVSDISHASDGERAVMSLAFSLSLARITSKKYNILLLDEMDTSLDAYSKGKYIDMIDAYMKLIHAHQVFLISHNSVFDNYPVNVLMTSEMNVSNVKKKNIVRLYKGGSAT